MAEKRLILLEKKFERDDDLKREYVRVMAEYLEKGYSRELHEDELSAESDRTWYLPHFAVHNPNKPGKFRLVFDAAAKVDGCSLNSALSSGPDQCQPLPAVLMKFRQRGIGVRADIVEMFHQVMMRESDQAAQRFLWRANPDEPIKEYAMAVMTFGATCSPCSAQYVKNSNALEFTERFPEAVSAILNNHYVDDLVHSFTCECDALRILPEIVWIHKRAGFDLTRFVSNSRLVNQRFNDDAEKPKVFSLDKEAGTFQKVLGMCWDTGKDALRFATAIDKIDRNLLNGMAKCHHVYLRSVRPSSRMFLGSQANLATDLEEAGRVGRRDTSGSRSSLEKMGGDARRFGQPQRSAMLQHLVHGRSSGTAHICRRQ
ncbi:uncharacterized protein LOC118736611 [Rhagoletis pomonella]|uniref:uncharacterized protein LOC118736611 n=1 Tax=Rhagoletis pomonella TaxID=28610 RepID=UPI001784011D|nr:uncharacterized protein LOC118736611 [Rhagoletis pomonella]